ncbi:hypothetical protein ACS0TY_018005 [Phlomoides rotata]
MEECFSHIVEYGNTVHFSFVVIKSEGSWHYSEDGVDLVVKGPNGVYVSRAISCSTRKKLEIDSNLIELEFELKNTTLIRLASLIELSRAHPILPFYP